jgi:hypothetical protein
VIGGDEIPDGGRQLDAEQGGGGIETIQSLEY